MLAWIKIELAGYETVTLEIVRRYFSLDFSNVKEINLKETSFPKMEGTSTQPHHRGSFRWKRKLWWENLLIIERVKRETGIRRPVHAKEAKRGNTANRYLEAHLTLASYKGRSLEDAVARKYRFRMFVMSFRPTNCWNPSAYVRVKRLLTLGL